MSIITDGYGEVASSSPPSTGTGVCKRLLESGAYRLLESGKYRLLEGVPVGPTGTSAGSLVTAVGDTALATVFCTDEHIAIRAGGDFHTICPQWQLLAGATDGAIAGGSWNLYSASTLFDSTGVGLRKGSVVILQKPAASFHGSGQMFAVESVTGNYCSLRRIGQRYGVGLPPCTSDVSGITFVVPTLTPQIEEASFLIDQRWRIDPAISGRTPTDIYDPRVLRQLCVLKVLVPRYSHEARKPDSEFAIKYYQAKNELSELESQCEIRWGSAGKSQPSTNMWSGRISR